MPSYKNMKSNAPDNFQTPWYAVSPLLYHLKPKATIWECASGHGYIAKYLSKNGFNVIATDVPEYNFLTYEPEEHYDYIITNPPYSIKNDFLKRAYELKKPFAFLLPLSALESNTRQQLYAKYGLDILLMNARIDFKTPSGEGSGSWFATAWFTHMMLDEQMVFYDIKKDKQLFKDLNPDW